MTQIPFLKKRTLNLYFKSHKALRQVNDKVYMEGFWIGILFLLCEKRLKPHSVSLLLAIRFTQSLVMK